MNIDELSQMSEGELHLRANAHLEQLDKQFVSEMQKEHHVSQAQFYLAELQRRVQAKERAESERIGKRDYKLELWVIGLIGAELVLAIVGIVFGWVEGSKQAKVLDQLNQSSAATAASLTALRQAQEASLDTQKHTLENITAMNNSLQHEMDLNLTDAIQWGGGISAAGHEQVNLENHARTVLWLCGSRFGTAPTAMRQRPTILIPGSSVPFDFSDLITRTIKSMGTETEAAIPFSLYLKGENGTKYVSMGTVQVTRNNNVYFIGQVTTTRRQW